MSKKQVPQTSKDARASLEPEKIRVMYRKILEALAIKDDCTYEEIAEILGDKPDRIWKRLGEMGKLNLIHRPGERKVMSSKRMGFVWRLGPGKDILKQKKKLKKEPTIVDYSKAILNQPSISSNIQCKLF